MLMQGQDRTLSRLIAVRMSAVAIVLSSALLGLFFVRYAFDKPLLRKLTLEAEVSNIATAVKHGQNPTDGGLYRKYPRHYGFRVVEIRPKHRPMIVASANAGLLPDIDGDGDDLVPGLGPDLGATGAGKTGVSDKWLLTDYDRDGRTVRWVQAAMVGDPAHLWIWATIDELGDRILFPILLIVPALTLAVFLVTRRALRPLSEIARHAQALADSPSPAGQFAPLSPAGLPRELRAVIAAVNRVLAQLDRSLTLQKQFTSDVAHELRTPLAVLLLEVSELPPGPAAERFRVELCALRDLVNGLLQLAQAEETMTRERHRVDLTAVARRVCEDFAPTALNQHKTIAFDAADTDVSVAGHATLIDVAIRNLVDNAIKATPSDSTITVDVKRNGSITVEDCGPGVPHHHKELIFKRFWRAEPRQGGGTGIGLALVRRIALLHGGDVRVEDRQGGGARFVLALMPTQTPVPVIRQPRHILPLPKLPRPRFREA